MLRKYLLFGSVSVFLLAISTNTASAAEKNGLKQRLKSVAENQQLRTDQSSNAETKISERSNLRKKLSVKKKVNLLPGLNTKNNSPVNSLIVNQKNNSHTGKNNLLPNVAQLSQPKKEDSKPIKSTDSLDSLKGNNTQAADLLGDSQQSINQVTNVSQLDDVQPTDWAYEALRNLVERYGCIAGYPNGTFRGNRAMTRYEFAAGLNACLEQINQLIAESTANLATNPQQDLETIKRLSDEFKTELAALRQRIDAVEERTAILESQQFSTTTKMNGEAIFAIVSGFGGDPPGGCRDVNLTIGNLPTNVINCGNRNDANPTAPDDPATNTAFVHLVRIGLQTSFTGKDVLRTFLTTGNFNNGGFTNPESFNTYMARFSFQSGLENNVFLDRVEYRFPAFNDRVVFSVIPYGFNLSSVLSANSPYFDIGRGSISRFGQLNPILRIGGAMDTGVGFDWAIADPIRLQVAYGTRNSGDPAQGLFGADHSTFGAQLVLKPTKNIITGISYVNSYNNDGVLGTYTGSVNAETNGLWSGGRLPDANLRAFPGPGIEIGDLPAKTNAIGASLQWRVTDKITFGAWGGYTFTNFLEGIPDFGGDGDSRVRNPPVAGKKPFGNTATYLFSLGISDPFGREGDLFAFLFGMPPKLVNAGPETAGQSVPLFEQVVRDEDPVRVSDNDPRTNPRTDAVNGDPNNGNLRPEGSAKQFGRKDEATSLHFEVFYRFKVNDNLSITPGFFFVTNPGHIADNDTLFVGTIRTTFRF